MIDLQSLCAELLEIVSKESFLFLDWSPNDPDSTTLVNLALKIRLQSTSGYSRTLDLNSENSFSILRLIESVLSSKKVFIIGYNFKSIFSYYRRVCHHEFVLSNFVDLYWFESYRSLESSKGNLSSSIANFKSLIKNDIVYRIFANYYRDLIGKVIPAIESFQILNDDSCTVVYSNYHIEGQENGRLSCSCDKKNVFNPHSLGEEKKNLLFYNQIYRYFMQFDYRNMEVSVLACLADDPVLLEIVQSPDNNVYSKLFERITGLKNHEDAKNLGKKIFLPLIYGQTKNGLAKSLDISIDQAEIYYNSASKVFRKSFEFVETAQSDASANGYLEDCFQRKRYFIDGESYKARNFIIQSPSALICLESLLKLYREAKENFAIAFHVHDGYFLAIKKDNIEESFYVAKKILESKLSLMPNLQLKVSASLGKTLDKMILLEKRKEGVI